ncbi:CpsD/CapB family tyrosine-protein kinase [Rhodovulum sulfidophilum]|uniref:CpsD/CapB family tyrosine-protein kinase n=1 Tax=Rhodovulum sulfidophilum TaxID=35806 RepID=UPI0019231C5E|nr:CpsD/CapB family tyrosine-protein kinase [Rhodovulum sulfidophilum]MBL3575111.1 CpsD/CapB family tyrosine-protein kinase [Rhodovulum sulfidophilum]MCE8432149.1 CpsD/CapB family tyrosine-protein kinase [Rhodovulum sulfidophilum]MCF4116932.1 CpsD/CapB family tyrosine-protein kinase [Rhodovulum sulfidophilum]
MRGHDRLSLGSGADAAGRARSRSGGGAGLAAEAFRSLRTALRFGLIDAKRRSIAITGPTSDAGKSFVSLNLAVVMAQADQSVCLIDADMRRGELTRRLGLPDGLSGLSDYLAGDTELDAVLRPAPVGGLSLIPTGIYPPNPS